jgi:methyl-accepting chemotaxis protein
MSRLSSLFTSRHVAGQLEALNRSQAVIEFDFDRPVLNANENFLSTLGYTLAEIKGQHHSMFVTPDERDGVLQAVLGRSRPRRVLARAVSAPRQGRQGGLDPGELQPDPGRGGKPVGVVKFATDITEQKNRLADLEGQQQAISKAQAVIEFDLTGKVLHANENFPGRAGLHAARDRRPPSQHVRRPAERDSRPIGSSGSGSGAANTRPRNIAASARAARRSGSRRATTRS